MEKMKEIPEYKKSPAHHCTGLQFGLTSFTSSPLLSSSCIKEERKAKKFSYILVIHPPTSSQAIVAMQATQGVENWCG